MPQEESGKAFTISNQKNLNLLNTIDPNSGKQLIETDGQSMDKQ